MKRRADPGWKIEDGLRALRAAIDPYIWEQGQELHRRGAVDDFQMSADGSIQVTVLDPRDSRRFFVKVTRDGEGRVRGRCECPYRLGGLCRHQVVALEYLRSVAQATQAEDGEAARSPKEPVETGPGDPGGVPRAPVLYRLATVEGGVRTAPDGSLLRIALHALGSLRRPHRVGLQLFTGTGWTELRTSDVDRWISRGGAGPHPRDEVLASSLLADGSLLGELDSERLARILSAVAGTEALVDRSGLALEVSLWPWRLECRVAKGETDGLSVRFQCRSAEGGEVPFEELELVPSVTPWIQTDGGRFHPLIAGVSGPVLAELQEEDLSDVRGEDLDRLLGEGISRLETICRGAVETEPGLIEEVEGVTGARLLLEGTPVRLEGRLELRYGDEWVPAERARAPWTRSRDGKFQRYPPAGQSLARAHRELEASGFRPAEDGWRLEGPGALARVLSVRPDAFVRIELPSRLEALDLVRREPVLTLRVDTVAGARRGSPGEGFRGEAEAPEGGRRAPSGIGWLEISPALSIGGRVVPLDLESFARSVRRDPRGVCELPDGTVLSLEHESVKALAELSTGDWALPPAPSAGGPGPSLRVPLPVVTTLLEDVPGRRVELSASVRGLVEELGGGEPGEAEPLRPQTDAILRPYQREAVRWFGLLSRWGLAGILADEMGLGKTVMALTHLFGREGAEGPGAGGGPVLVVCPSSLVFNWLDECRRFFPGVRAIGLHGESRSSREERIQEGVDLLVTSYALLRRDREALESREFRAVVLDEAQHIKNSESQTAQAAFALRAPERWALTGTPVENHLGELWSLFRFLMPGFLGAADAFHARYADPISRGEADVLRRLRARVHPFLLRRTKSQVLRDLPPRIEQVERVPMTDPQRVLYESYLLEARAQLQKADPSKARFQVLAALTRLRQICCHPGLVGDAPVASAPGDPEDGAGGGKFELLEELLESSIEEGHRVLLYSQFTSMLDLIEERLDRAGISHCRLDGSTRDREAAVRRFTRDSSIPVFLISLKAGGLGLNLTQADTVILYDPWWNPAAEDQAAARAHRIGQEAPVHVHKLITKDTVEEKILELQSTKKDLAARIVESGEEALGSLSVEELRGLILE